MTQREQLHALVEAIPETEIPPAVRFLEFLKAQGEDPFTRAHFNAPIDDEPATDDDLLALDEGLEDLAEGRTVSHQEVGKQMLAGS